MDSCCMQLSSSQLLNAAIMFCIAFYQGGNGNLAKTRVPAAKH